MNATHDALPPRPGARAMSSRQSRVRGSVVVNAVIAMSLVLIVLIGTELGYLFYMKRELQKAVDLSALAGTQILKAPNCATATSTASANAAKNLPFLASQYTITVTCGVWDPTAAALKPTYFSTSGTAPINALHVQIVGQPPLLFPSLPGNNTRAVSVEAYAVKDDPLAVFSVGSKLVDINSNAPLISILKFAGADITGTCVGCYTGLAGVKITPGGLLAQLGIPITTDLTVAGLNALLAAKKVTLGQLLDAVATVAGQSSLLSANVSLINSLVSAGLSADSLLVQLGTDPSLNNGVRGLFAQISAPTAGSALNVQVDALDLVTAAVGVGTSGHAVTVDTGVNPLGVTLQARVIEPPSIGIGGVGTTAYNSQIRVFLNIDSTGSVLGGLLGALSTKIQLPIAIDVVNALGTLKSINCDVVPHQATINVDAPILSACIGQIPTASLWSKTNVCSTDLSPMPLVTLLGVPLLQGKVSVPALPWNEDVTLAVGETKSTTRNPLAIGDTLSTLLNQLLQLLLGAGSGSGTPANRATTPALAASLADYYLAQGGGKVSTVQGLLANAGLTWNRPGGLLGLFSTTMPNEWAAIVGSLPLAGGCTPLFGTPTSSCIRSTLINSLQSPNQDGLVTGLLKVLVNLVSGLLGIGANDAGTPLLSVVLGPVIQLLQPILNAVGGLLSNLLGNVLGLELGRTDVNLQSLSCQNARLVY